MTAIVQGVGIPDSKLARAITELVRDTESSLLFHHSSRVYYWGALAGKRRGLKFDAELLYAGAMFHDMGLTPSTAASINASKSTARIPLATSCAATASPRQTSTRYGRRSRYIRRRTFRPHASGRRAGHHGGRDGRAGHRLCGLRRHRAKRGAHPRDEHFKEDILQAFYAGMKHRPDSTFGTVNDDVLADKNPAFKRINFCSVIRELAWVGSSRARRFRSGDCVLQMLVTPGSELSSFGAN